MASEVLNFHTYSVYGVHCSQCIKKLKGLVKTVPGAEEIIVDMSRQQLKVRAQEEFSSNGFTDIVQNLGFEIRKLNDDGQASEATKKEKKRLIAKVGVSGALAGNIMLLSYSVYLGAPEHFSSLFNVLSGLLFIPVLFYGATPFFQASLVALKNKKPSIDLPLAIAILGGGVLSYYNLLVGNGHIYFDSLAALVFFILGSRLLSRTFQEKYLAPIALQDLLPEQLFYKVINDELEEVGPASLEIGDEIEISCGQVIPIDGRVLSDSIFVDNSLMTGESDPVELKKWSEVFAGAYCLSDYTRVEVTRKQSDCRINSLMEKINNALNRDGTIVELTDKFSNYFTYGVFGAGLLFFVLYSFISLPESINRVLALFVIACPCAIAITTPIVLRLSAKSLLKKNFLLKDLDVFERLTRCRSVVFDKTGTLTESLSEALSWTPSRPVDKDAEIIYELERRSSHPVAKGILRSLQVKGSSKVSVFDFQEINGVGVEGVIDGDKYSLKRVSGTENHQVGFFKNEVLLSQVQIGTKLRSESKQEIQKLREMGLDVYLLTGDSKQKSIDVAKELEIPLEKTLYNKTSEEKNELVQKLTENQSVVYVGDGLNDSLAMSNGMVGISMNQSVEATFSASNIHILKDGITGLSNVFKQSQNTIKTIKALLRASITYNTIFGICALSGVITPLLTAILMPISSLCFLGFGVYKARSFSK